MPRCLDELLDGIASCVGDSYLVCTFYGENNLCVLICYDELFKGRREVD